MAWRDTTVALGSERYAIDTELLTARSISIPANLGPLGGRQAGEPSNRQVIAIGLVCIFIFGLFTLNFVLPHRALSSFVLFNQDVSAAPAQKPAPTYQVAQHLVRIGQLDPAQYTSSQEYNLWAYSTCSTAAMTEVMGAYGRHYRVTDVLQVEARIGEITRQLGLLERVAVSCLWNRHAISRAQFLGWWEVSSAIVTPN